MPAISACNGASIICIEKSPHISEQRLTLIDNKSPHIRKGSITVIDADSLDVVHRKCVILPGFDDEGDFDDEDDVINYSDEDDDDEGDFGYGFLSDEGSLAGYYL
jgi:hypothetical protein